jgi:(2S)-methylsuccinyl-CoA dehydrogenase
MPDTLPVRSLMDQCGSLLAAAERLHEATRHALSGLLAPDGKPSAKLIEKHQFSAHGLSWQATYVEALRQTLAWAGRLQADGKLSVAETAMLRLGFAEYGQQLAGGIPMSQSEMIRPGDMGVPAEALAAFAAEPALSALADRAGLEEARLMLEATREQFLRFGAAEITPFAPEWHAKNELIPIELVNKMAELGVFGLTIPEEFGGMGLGKVSMCVVSEALSRGYIGVGSLGTRSEIAAELILWAARTRRRRNGCRSSPAGEVLPTAVFTEPNTGSDLGSLRTKAVKRAGGRCLEGLGEQDLDHPWSAPTS